MEPGGTLGIWVVYPIRFVQGDAPRPVFLWKNAHPWAGKLVAPRHACISNELLGAS